MYYSTILILTFGIILCQGVPSLEAEFHRSSYDDGIAEERRFTRQRRSPITYGKHAKIAIFPYFVAIEYLGELVGGGSIISRYYVVTAAHLFDIFLDEHFFLIRAGTDSKTFGGSEHYLDHYQIHPDYIMDDGANGCVNDIALIRVKNPFIFDEYRQPIPLYNSGEESKPGTLAVVVGFGQTEEGSTAYQLKMATMQITDRAKCNATWFPAGEVDIPESAICAGVGKDKHDTCNHDSGGPLVIGRRLAGITSFGDPRCGITGVPSLYTEIAQFREWIDGIVDSSK